MNIISGIYCIRSRQKNIYYIGQSLDIYVRWYEHKRILNKQEHYNVKLQRHFNKYGIDDLEFSVLSSGIANERELNFLERFFIICFDSWKNGFNSTQGGDGGVWKYCILKSLITGSVAESHSIREFARKHHICRKLVGDVLLGKRKFVGEWYNPKGVWKPKFKYLKDPFGNVHKFYFINRFAKEKKLRTSDVHAVLNGRYQSTNGWTRISGTNYKRGVFFELIDPKGILHQGKNLQEFARIINEKLTDEQKVNGHTLACVRSGTKKSHKGWTKFIKDENYKHFNSKSFYRFISPDGDIVESDTIDEIATQYNLEIHKLSQVWTEKHESYDGWKKAI